jgi:ABC-2 type transport system permease protein
VTTAPAPPVLTAEYRRYRRYSAVKTVMGKDLAVTWATPVPYVVGALFQAVLGVLFVDQLQGRSQALVQPLFPLAGFLLLVTVPVLTMRAFAEEARTGSLDVLLAIPVPSAALAVGKWLAAWLTVLAVVAPAAVYAGLVALLGEPDRGPIVAGFLGLVLLTAALTSLGTLASSLTSSQPVAAMIGFVVAAVLWFSGAGGSVITVGGLLAHLSLSERLRSFAGGAVDTGDVGFLVALTIGLLGLTIAAVEARRQR